jgi:hypothetical protein
MGDAKSALKFVFCEGGDDEAVLLGVAQSSGLTDLRVERFEGKNQLRDFLGKVQKRPEFAQKQVTSLAIVRDADESDAVAFQSVCDSLRANGFPAPNQNGAFAIGELKAGVLVIGPNGGRGMIEDLCLQSVSDRPEFSCVDEYFRCISERSARATFTSKARVRVWMASHLDYDLRVGLAAAAGYWPWDNPVFDEMKRFLRAL